MTRIGVLGAGAWGTALAAALAARHAVTLWARDATQAECAHAGCAFAAPPSDGLVECPEHGLSCWRCERAVRATNGKTHAATCKGAPPSVLQWRGSVEARRCPHCRRAVEKRDGCDMVLCACARAFDYGLAPALKP